MLGLEWQRVDLKAGLIYFGAEHQKNGKVGSIASTIQGETLPSVPMGVL